MMLANVKTALVAVSTTLGITSLSFKTTYIEKCISRKRDRNGNYTFTSRTSPISLAVNDPYAPLAE
jgi:hypothetical protein